MLTIKNNTDGLRSLSEIFSPSNFNKVVREHNIGITERKLKKYVSTYDPISLAEQEELEDFLIHLPFITKLEKELSKPRRRNDNELDYLPTQYLSEFIKSIGFDGVEYLSSVYSKGYNIAVFNPGKLDCVNVKVYEIKNIDLTHKAVDYK